VCSISHKNETSYSETRSTPLLQLIRTGIHQFVVSRLGVPWQKMFITHWLSLEILFRGQTDFVPICYAPHAIGCDFRCHIPVFWMDDKVRVPVAELVEVIINLQSPISCPPSKSTPRRKSPAYICSNNLTMQSLSRILLPKQRFSDLTIRPITS
jgi:hypothetical protein